VDVGDLPKHVKYCVLVCLASNGQLSEHHWSTQGELESPTIGIRAYGLKRCLIFCSKIKVVKIMFWPNHCVEEEETKPLVKTASKLNTGNGRTRRQALARWLATRLFRPDGLTWPEYQTTQPTWLTRIRMMSAWRHYDVSMHNRHAKDDVSLMSACTVGMPCQQPVSWHVISLEPSQGTGSSGVDPTCNRIWDWIWAVYQARIVLIKS
jgi:hypothetical protein